MFISKHAIDQLVAEHANDIGVKLIGITIDYFALVDGENGVTGMEAIITRAEPGEDRNGPFTVDLALFTPVQDIFFVLKDLVVYSLEMVDRKDESVSFGYSTVCLAKDVDKIREIVDAPRYGELSLVPNPD